MTPWIRWNADTAPAEPAWRWLAEDLGMPALLATPPRPRADMVLPTSRLAEAPKQKLLALLGRERVHLDDDARIGHAHLCSATGQLRLRDGDLSQAPDMVVYPRHEDDVLGLLRICADADIAVIGQGMETPGKHAATLACDMTGMTDILSLDAMSGLALVEAGIASTELARQLAARGLGFGPANFSTLGGWVARGIGTDGVEAIRVATPQGLLPSGRNHIAAGFGIVTAATLHVHAAPARTLPQSYLFPDFASGLAAMREAQRESVGQPRVRLSDGGETRFQRRLAGMGQRPTLWQRMEDAYRGIRRLDDGAAALDIIFNGRAADVEIARKRFAALAKRLGARQCAPAAPAQDYRSLLLDRGVTVDRVRAAASWSNLPVLYAALRAALDQAMRLHAPREGAHGLVLAQVAGARHDGADLCCSFIFPRRLDGDIAQAQAVRQAALDVLGAQARAGSPLETDIRRAVKSVLDPKNILGTPPA
jgi:alkyldihydroxyacetonephosphate synthase